MSLLKQFVRIEKPMSSFLKKYRAVLAIYFFLTLVALRKLLLAPGIVGHNWDWSIPYLPEYLRHIVKTAHFTWSNLGFGRPSPFQANLIIYKYLLYFGSFFNLSGAPISKLVIFLAVFLSSIFMFFLSLDLIRKRANNLKTKSLILPASFMAGLFYGFSPFLFQDLIGGSWTHFLTYPLFPLAILFYRQDKFWLTVITLCLMATSLHNFLLVNFFLLAYTLFLKREKFKKLVLIYLLTFLFNLYWLFPILSSYTQGAVTSLVPTSDAWIEGIKTNVASFSEILIATGYFRPLFTMSIKSAILPFWKIISYFFVALVVFFANLFLSGKKKPYFWLGFLLFSFIPATGGKFPLGGIMVWLYQRFPLMNLFRSPQHFLILPTFTFAILIGLGSFYSLKKLNSPKGTASVVFGALVACLIIWLHPFLIYGDLGKSQLSSRYGGGNYLDVYQLSPGYQEALGFLAQKKDDYRTLVLPMTFSPYYLNSEYQSIAQGGDPQILTSPQPMIVSEYIPNKNLAPVLQVAQVEFYLGRNQQLVKNFLGLTSAGYILLRKDVLPYFSPESNIWDYQTMEEFLNSIPFLTKIQTSSQVDLFKVDNQILAARFYIPQSLFQIKGDLTKASEIITLKDFSSPPLAFVNDPVSQPTTPIISPEFIKEPVANKALYRFDLPDNDHYQLVIKEAETKAIGVKIDGFSLQPDSPPQESRLSFNLDRLDQGKHYLELSFDSQNLAALGDWQEFSEPKTFKNKVYQEYPLSAIIPPDSKIFTKTVDNYLSGAYYQLSLDYSIEKSNGQAGVIILEERGDNQNQTTWLKLNKNLYKRAGANESKEHFAASFQATPNSKSATLYFWGSSPKNSFSNIAFDNVLFRRVFKPTMFLTQVEDAPPLANNAPVVSFEKKSPVEYQVKINKTDQSFLLIFNETFHPGWKAYFKDKKQPLPEKDHLMANGYANAWLIGGGGEKERQIIIKYQPQKVFYLGLILSGSSILLVLLLSTLLLPKIQSKRLA